MVKAKMHISYIALISVIAFMVSCGGRGHMHNNGTSIDEADTIDTPSEAIVTEPIAPLPDTIYQSAAIVKYKIDIFDSDINADIDSYIDPYDNAPGAFTFRKGIWRQGDFGGHVNGEPTDINVDWTFTTDFRGNWGGGTGWTGQPLYVNWPDSLAKYLKSRHLVNENFSGQEIIAGSLSGRVYFIDLESGKATRSAIDTYNPIKGTMSLDPSLNGNLYVGQGIPDTIPFGALVIDLFRNEVSHVFDVDTNAYRRWSAYDSSPLRMGQYLFRPGENGTLYKWMIKPGKLTLQSTMRYKVNGFAPGMEASMSVYRNYGYIADNHGNVICVNLCTMKPVWHYAVGDDIDSSIVLIEEGGTPYIYTGSEVDLQKQGNARYVKLDALDGSRIWQVSVPACQYISEEGKHFDGGFYSTALPGVGDCDSLLFINCVLNDTILGQDGQFMAIDRYKGKVRYTRRLKHYAWSSPVGFLNENGKMYVVTADCRGYVYLIDGRRGQVIQSKSIGANFESSPVVVGNHLIIGSRGNKIYKLSIN